MINIDKKRILILEPALNSYKNSLFFKSKEPNVSIYRCIYELKKNYDVEYIDFKTDKITKTKLFSKFSNFDLIILNIKSYNYLLSTQIINKILKIKNKDNNKIDLILIGQYPESRYENILNKYGNHKDQINIFIGESYLLGFKLNEIYEKYISKEIDIKDIFENNVLKLSNHTNNLDNIPLIDITEFSKRDYYSLYPMKGLSPKKWFFMNITEGCSHNCIFCSQTLRISHGTEFKIFSVNETILRIKRALNSDYNIIRFIDDDFLGNKKYIENLCKELIRNKIKFRWMAQVRADKIDNKIIKLMKKAGCESLNFGIESGSKRILKILKKGENLETMKNAVKICKKNKIKFVCYFMIGSPSETLNDIKKSIKLSFRFAPDVLQVGFFTPYEGSPFYENNKEFLEKNMKKTIFHYDAGYLNFSKVKIKKLNHIFFWWNFLYYIINPIKSFKIIFTMLFLEPKRTVKIASEIFIRLTSKIKKAYFR
jgi:radical SAM superfamily enzyme YgiQ (UPF0313 family)